MKSTCNALAHMYIWEAFFDDAAHSGQERQINGGGACVCARHEDVKQDPTTPDNLRVVDASHTFNKRCNHMTNAFILVYMVFIKGCTKN